MAHFFAAVPQNTPVTLLSKPQGDGDMLERPQTYDIILTNLPNECTRMHVQNLFSQYRDKIQSITVKPDSMRDSLKISYVRFTERPLADRLAEEFNGRKVIHNQITCKRTEVKVNRNNFNNCDKKQQFQGRNNGPSQQQTPAVCQPPPKWGSWHQQGPHPQGPPQPNHQTPPIDWGAHRQKHNQDERSHAVQTRILKKEQVFLAYVDSPVEFWAQKATGDAPALLLEMDGEMRTVRQSEHCRPITELGPRPEFNTVYCAQFSEDNLWYRCEAKSYVSDSKTVMLYIDFGNHEAVYNDVIYTLPPELAAKPALAQKYRLRDVQPCTMDRLHPMWAKGMEVLKSLTDGKPAVIHTHSPDDSHAGISADLYSLDGRDLKEELISLGCLVPTNRPERTPPKETTFKEINHGSKGSNHAPFKNGFQNMQSSPQAENFQNAQSEFFKQGTFRNDYDSWQAVSYADYQGGYATADGLPSPTAQAQLQRALMGRGGSSPPQQQQQHNSQMHAQQQNHHGQHPPQQQQRPPQTPQQKRVEQQAIDKMRGEMQAKIDKAHRDLEKTKRDAAQEVGTYQSKVKLLEEEMTNLRNRLEHVDISSKLSNLVSAVGQVRKIRQQFPTSENPCDDVLEQAIALITSPEGKLSPDIELISSVQGHVTACSRAQDQIRQCKKQEDLPGLISERDEHRRSLHEALVLYVDTTSHLPLDERRQQLNATLESLRQTYSNYLTDGPTIMDTTLDQLINNYHDWKFAKSHDLSAARTITNTCHNTLHGALQTLQEHLSVDDPSIISSPVGGPPLDQMINKFSLAVQNEMRVSNFEHTSDSPVITKMVKHLAAELSDQVRTLDNLSRLAREYRAQRDELSPWLSAQPDLANITAVRKNFRALKSRLRHKLADLQDAEESDDHSDVAAIRDDIKQVRESLHAAFIEEDQLMTDIVKLYENHFPELELLNPDLGLDTYAAHGGVLKPWLDIDQFELSPFPHSDKPYLHMSAFNGRPAVIKDYILDDGERRHTFMQALAAYGRCTADNICPIQAAFMHKNQRQCYIVMPYYPALTPRVEEGTLTDEEVYAVLSGVLRSLCVLHGRDVTHASLHHRNVFLDDEQRGVLSEFDFSKTEAQRSAVIQTTSSGLVFNAPETRADQASCGPASDMYSFGILMLYLLSPETSFPLGEASIPEYQGYGLKQNYTAMLDRLLVVEPGRRATASQLLHSPYMAALAQTSVCSQHASLQLRSKSPSPTNEKKNGNGILKNGKSRATSPPSPGGRGLPPSGQALNQTPLDGQAGTATEVVETPANDPEELVETPANEVEETVENAEKSDESESVEETGEIDENGLETLEDEETIEPVETTDEQAGETAADETAEAALNDENADAPPGLQTSDD